MYIVFSKVHSINTLGWVDKLKIKEEDSNDLEIGGKKDKKRKRKGKPIRKVRVIHLKGWRGLGLDPIAERMNEWWVEV